MEPRLGSRGKPDGAALSFYAVVLQWSRDLEVAESCSEEQQDKHDEQASMEPRLGSRGKPRSEVRSGASDSASMEPRLGSRGKLSQTLESIPTNLSLQWSRDLEVAERFYFCSGLRSVVELQWSRDLEVAESSRTGQDDHGKPKLQWSRDLEVAESPVCFHWHRLRDSASMEPRLGSRGKVALATAFLTLG